MVTVAGLNVGVGVGDGDGDGDGVLEWGGGPPLGGRVDGTDVGAPPEEQAAHKLQKARTRTERRNLNPF